MIMKPWNLKLHGRGIAFGTSIHVITSADRTVRLTTWSMNEHQGHIEIGDAVLICPGVRIDSACRVSIGESTMLLLALTSRTRIGMTFMTALSPLVRPPR